jgi:hypothetical protein
MTTLTDKDKIIKTIISSKKRILLHLQKVVETHDFDYKTFGTAIEDFVLDEIIKILTEGKIISSKNDFKRADNKNEFPDLRIIKPCLLALEVKSGNHSRKKGGQWITCKNSNNDMGTLNTWANKIKELGGENIYYIFIEYDFNDSTRKILDINIRPFYEFLTYNESRILRYREKDGNLRPKDFDSPPKIVSAKEFEGLLLKTRWYRSSRIIKKHIKSLPEKQLDELYKELGLILKIK